MQHLSLTSCGFSGTIPSCLGNLLSLVHLGIAFNSLVGTLPKELGQLVLLRTLYARQLTICDSLQVSDAMTDIGPFLAQDCAW